MYSWSRAAPEAARAEFFQREWTFDMPIKPRVGAVILIVLGALFLLSNLGMLPRLGPLFAQWWPLILIVVGVSMLVRR
jgi:cell wall-active antibiotic response 4TMS protein YvqF